MGTRGGCQEGTANQSIVRRTFASRELTGRNECALRCISRHVSLLTKHCSAPPSHAVHQQGRRSKQPHVRLSRNLAHCRRSRSRALRLSSGGRCNAKCFLASADVYSCAGRLSLILTPLARVQMGQKHFAVHVCDVQPAVVSSYVPKLNYEHSAWMWVRQWRTSRLPGPARSQRVLRALRLPPAVARSAGSALQR